MNSREQRELELKCEYEKFLQHSDGKKWRKEWQERMRSDRPGDFGDFLYDFYTEMLM